VCADDQLEAYDGERFRRCERAFAVAVRPDRELGELVVESQAGDVQSGPTPDGGGSGT
jgi:hypothetical protein